MGNTHPMWIDHIRVENFKSLVGFDLSLNGFNCLIGLNGAGKSTVLQFMDFLAQQVKGDIKGWLEERDWKASELTSRLGKSRKKLISFTVSMHLMDGSMMTREAAFNTDQQRCTQEKIVLDCVNFTTDTLLTVADGAYTPGNSHQSIRFSYQGSILSQLLDKGLSDELKAFKLFFRQFRSLELLAPQFLRQKARNSEGKMGLGGQRMSAYIHEMSQEHKNALRDRLKKAYPRLQEIKTRSIRSGWKALNIAEVFEHQELPTEARHVNDGMLRIMAILAQLMTDHSFMAFDEVENGINPELIEFLIDTLVQAEQQVLVTTHSPMILNFMEDDIATRSVQYLYKTAKGYTRAIPFFSIPSLKEKLTVMGPGEAFIDTDLNRLADEVNSL
ncbi:AAA family ATPase [Endozoicomonas sp. ONNA2]|uniref:AAA family ATPase n=1 Tax=Endozoicomonas sp. ONNA2 TaxID=2828741 RepID=UPI002148977B|nr:ATP-binding protein [Endozoicomonas sp. ONNA2]